MYIYVCLYTLYINIFTYTGEIPLWSLVHRVKSSEFWQLLRYRGKYMSNDIIDIIY